MAEGATLVLGIIATFLAIIVFLLGALILKVDQVVAEMRRRLGHIDNKLTRMEVSHEGKTRSRVVEANQYASERRAHR